jgi:hypothetical protein
MMKRFYDGRIKHNDLVAGLRADIGRSVLPTVQLMRPFKFLITHVSRSSAAEPACSYAVHPAS